MVANGHFVVFASGCTDKRPIWRMDLDGANPRQLTSGNDDYLPDCSPDGRWVVYASVVAGKWTLWKAPMDSGEAVQLTDGPSYSPAISPDGKLIADTYSDAQNRSKIGIIPFKGGSPTKVLEPPANASFALGPGLGWGADGRALTYVVSRGGVSNIGSQPIDGAPPKPVTDFQSENIFSFDWSPDGKQLAMARRTEASNVVLMSDFR